MKTSVLLVLALTGLRLAAEITVAPDRANGTYAPGEKVVWTVTGAAGDPVSLNYTVKKDGQVTVSEGVIDLSKGPATIAASRDDAGALLANFFAAADPAKSLGAGGAIYAPEKIAPSAPAPADFDAFWKAKLAELASVPANPALEKVENVPNSANVDYFKVTLDNIRGTKVRGQLARPSAPGKYPAIVTFQYAGVYPLKADTVVSDARAGWLALNISAHDLPIDEKPEFYESVKNGALENYVYQGSEDRETSYFLRMFLGCVRAVDYVASLPEWDGKTLIVTGASQGGLQTFAAAGLCPKVTGLMVVVPAGCDNYAPRANRAFGWPYWLSNWGPRDRDMAKVETTAGYFDAINFAAHAHQPALVAYGLIDTTSRPTGVAAAINALRGPKEPLVLTFSDHHGKNGAQKAYFSRAAEWKKLAKAGAPLPPAQP